MDYVVGADESSGGVGFGAGVAGAGALEYLWGEVVFEGVDGGLEHADIGVDATHVEVGPPAFTQALNRRLAGTRWGTRDERPGPRPPEVDS